MERGEARKKDITCYEIECEIGRGASGTCYKAKCKNDGKIVAIKKIAVNTMKVTDIIYTEQQSEAGYEGGRRSQKYRSSSHH